MKGSIGLGPFFYALAETLCIAGVLWLLCNIVGEPLTFGKVTFSVAFTALARTHALHHAAPSGDDA